MYPTTKTAGEAALKKKITAAGIQSEQQSALIALACPFGVKCYMLAFVFACLFSTSAFCSDETSSDNASQLFQRIGRTHNRAQIRRVLAASVKPFVSVPKLIFA